MDHSLAPLLWPLLAAVGIALLVLSWLQAKKRRQALLALAQRLKLLYNPGADERIPDVYGGTHLCSRGRVRRASNVIRGRLGGGDVTYFDYRFTEGSGKNQHTYSYSACAFEAPYVWRRLVVRPESFFDKAAAFFGHGDINLDNAEFNRKFCVECEDKKFAYDVLSQRAEEFFLARPGITMEMLDTYMLFYRPGTASPDEVERLIVSTPEFLDLIPHFLKEDRGMRHMDAAAASGLIGGAGAPMPGHAGGLAAPITGFVPDKQAQHKRPDASA